MKIPILHNHNLEQMIGTFIDGEVTLLDVLAQDKVYDCFGDIGIIVLEDFWVDNVRFIRRFRILEWSVSF